MMIIHDYPIIQKVFPGQRGRENTMVEMGIFPIQRAMLEFSHGVAHWTNPDQGFPLFQTPNPKQLPAPLLETLPAFLGRLAASKNAPCEQWRCEKSPETMDLIIRGFKHHTWLVVSSCTYIHIWWLSRRLWTIWVRHLGSWHSPTEWKNKEWSKPPTSISHYIQFGYGAYSVCIYIYIYRGMHIKPHGDQWIHDHPPRTGYRIQLFTFKCVATLKAGFWTDFYKQLIWLVVWTPLKNISQLGWWFPIYGKIKNVPKHQPVMIFTALSVCNLFLWGCYMVSAINRRLLTLKQQ